VKQTVYETDKIQKRVKQSCDATDDETASIVMTKARNVFNKDCLVH
jgi:hypothetical protein